MKRLAFIFLPLIFVVLFTIKTLHVHAAVGVSQFGPTTLYSGIVGWWTFDGKNMNPNVMDSSGLNETGTLSGFTSTTTVPGKVGQALSFASSSNQVVNIAATVPVTGNTITISAWMKLSETTLFKNIFVKLAGASNCNTSCDYEFYYHSSHTIGFFYSGQTGGDGHSATTITDTNWHHVVVVRNGDSETFYIDGGSVAGDTTSGKGTSALNNTTAGSEIGGDASGYMNGTLDDVRVYNRALSAQEVAELYNTTAGAKVATTPVGPQGLNTGLVAWWTFDGKNMNGTMYLDSSGNGNSGAVIGALGLVPGKAGQALHTDGTNSNQVQAVDSASLDITTNTVSVSFWVKSPITPPTFAGLVYKMNNGSNLGYGFDAAAGGTNPEFMVGIGGAEKLVKLTGVTTWDGKWHLLTGTYDGTNVTIYFDGQFNAQTAATGNIGDSTGTAVGIGSYPSLLAGTFVNATFDDVRIYNRALSAREISALYSSTGTGKMSVSQVGPQALNSGLLGWWTFDGKNLINNVADSSGNGSTGYLQNFTSTSSAVVLGKVGQALSFDGISQWASTTPVNLTGTAQASIVFWGNFPSFKKSVIQTIVRNVGDNTGSIFGIEIDDNNHGDCSTGAPQIVSFMFKTVFNQNCYAVTWSTNAWHHYVITYDQSTNPDVMQLYIDGALQTRNGGSLDANNSGNFDSGGFAVGSNVGQNQFTQGKLDDVRVYNRLLSQREITQLYNLGK